MRIAVFSLLCCSQFVSPETGAESSKTRTKADDPCPAAAVERGLCFFHAHPEKLSELGRQDGQRVGVTPLAPGTAMQKSKAAQKTPILVFSICQATRVRQNNCCARLHPSPRPSEISVRHTRAVLIFPHDVSALVEPLCIGQDRVGKV